jgi:predicted amino acid racemase
MFLEVLRHRNSRFVKTAMALHQQGKLPANAYVIDLDTVEANARILKKEADRLDLKVFAMTKQMGRNPSLCEALIRGGIDKAVAVDMACARACHAAGLHVGHLGHLVQIPKNEAAEGASLKPDYWTVFNDQKAQEAADAAESTGRTQLLLARIYAEGNKFYRGHEGGFQANNITQVADSFDALPGAHFAGITTFPALLFDQSSRTVKPTPNMETLASAARALKEAGRNDIEINAPGTTSTAVLETLKAAGATQCEPGHGLTGTTPLHVFVDLPETPAVLYLTEVSHHHAGSTYCYGGGLYIDPVFPSYDVKAIVSPEPTVAKERLYSVEIPPPSAIDYYGMIERGTQVAPNIGDTVVFGFRAQAFVTRANVVGVSGISRGKPEVQQICDVFGKPVYWFN